MEPNANANALPNQLPENPNPNNFSSGNPDTLSTAEAIPTQAHSAYNLLNQNQDPRTHFPDAYAEVAEPIASVPPAAKIEEAPTPTPPAPKNQSYLKWVLLGAAVLVVVLGIGTTVYFLTRKTETTIDTTKTTETITTPTTEEAVTEEPATTEPAPAAVTPDAPVSTETPAVLPVTPQTPTAPVTPINTKEPVAETKLAASGVSPLSVLLNLGAAFIIFIALKKTLKRALEYTKKK